MRPVQVLIVDDSAVVRGLLAQALETDPQIQIAGTAMHGEAALRALQKSPVDVVILDVEMPVMDGLTALPKILAEYPHVRVIMASSLTSDGAETTVKALALGAAGCIAKPQAASVGASIQELVRDLLPQVKALGTSHSSIRPQASTGSSAGNFIKTNERSMSGTPAIVVVGSSTGGPNALSRLVRGLHPEFSLPIVIVQHMPPMFTPMLAKHLQADSGRPCREASHGALLERGHTYVAPGDHHVVIEKRGDRMITTLNQAAPEHFCRPSVNPLFRSAADWYGSGVLGVMLTGMGDDGIEGTRDIVARNGYMIAQDEASSVVWGMPGAVARAGLANRILSLDLIAPAINQLCAAEQPTR